MKNVLVVCLGVIASLVFGPALAASKPSIGVAEFKNQTAASWWHGGVGWEMSGLVANELAATNKFKVVERSSLEPVLREQDLAASGRVAQGSAAKIGKLTGAQYLVMGTVTAFEHNTSSTGGGISFGGFSVGGKKESAYMAVDLRVVDTTTGDIAYVRTVEASSSSSGLNLGMYKSGLGGSLSQHNDTPVGKAIRAVIIEITDYLACAMVDQNSCMDEYDAKESARRERTKGSIDLQ